MKILISILCIFLFNVEQSKETDEVSIKEKLNMTTIELIKEAGYNGEQYETVTEDGYSLQLHRIPYGKDGPSDEKKTPVFVIHGIRGESTTWIDQGEKSLAYLLVNRGYDVWLGNFRGNRNSAHKKYTRKNPRFWDFTWDEHAKYDLPSMWDFVLEKTNASKIYNIGYSLGVATTLANLAYSDKYSSKFFCFFGLAPVSRLTYCTNEEYRLINIAFPILNIAGRVILAPYYSSGKPSCSPNCTDSELLLNKHGNSGTSFKALLHGLQLFNSKKFSHFDYKPVRNLITYHSLSPPIYDLTKVTTRVSLYSSANDDLANPVDVTRLQMDLQDVVHYRIVEKNDLFNHGDFVAHPEVDKYVYNCLIEDMQSIQT